MMKRMKRGKGFTLIEVLIAIAVIALIAVVSLPMFSMGLSNIRSSESNTKDLFDIQSKIESGEVDSATTSEKTLKFVFTGYPVEIPVKQYKVKLDSKDHVSITYFELIN